MIILDGNMWQNMFAMDLSVWEKVIRTVLVYGAILIIVRLFGRRLMAQMNSLDLVVVLLLSNVVQNSIIGNDNTITGGVIGAVILVLFNAMLDRLEHKFPALGRILEGRGNTLVKSGKPDDVVMARLGISHHELRYALKHQGADSMDDVKKATIQPGGNIVIDLKRNSQAADHGDVLRAIDEMRAHIDRRLTEAGIPLVADPPREAATEKKVAPDPEG